VIVAIEENEWRSQLPGRDLELPNIELKLQPFQEKENFLLLSLHDFKY
jgi:hypothetical protein